MLIAASEKSIADALRPLLAQASDLICTPGPSGRATAVEFPLAAAATLSEALRVCVDAGLPVEEAAPVRAPLDEVFARLTTRAGDDAAQVVEGT
jgi:hypothetical protein